MKILQTGAFQFIHPRIAKPAARAPLPRRSHPSPAQLAWRWGFRAAGCTATLFVHPRYAATRNLTNPAGASENVFVL